MNRLAIFLCIVVLCSCNSDRVFQGDVERIIESKQIINEEILRRMAEMIEIYGRQGLKYQSSIVKDFTITHEKVVNFLDTLDSIDRFERFTIANQFLENTFKPYVAKYPYHTWIDVNTPLQLIKLQIVDVESIYLREWEKNVTLTFNNISAAIIPDQIGFEKDKPITGTIHLMAYSDEMSFRAEVNNKEIDVKRGKGSFSIDPKELAKDYNRITAKIILGDTVFTTSIRVIIN